MFIKASNLRGLFLLKQYIYFMKIIMPWRDKHLRTLYFLRLICGILIGLLIGHAMSSDSLLSRILEISGFLFLSFTFMDMTSRIKEIDRKNTVNLIKNCGKL